jgi:hypothetical protein
MKTNVKSLTKEKAALPRGWEEWSQRGNYSVGHKRRAVLKCLNKETGEVRGFYSNLLLNPNLPDTDSLYPSVDHTTLPKNDFEMVVEARVINDMKSHLTEIEFWQIIEHLYAVGVSKGSVSKQAKRCDAWKPNRHFGKNRK